MGRHNVHTTSSLKAVRVVAAVTASAALPVVLPAEAMAELPAVPASPSISWQPIIQCESGGNPHAQNPGSTASGLVQFLDSSWAAYGGLKFGRRAKDATPAQQLEVANDAYRRSGLTPWTASRHCWGSHLRQIETGAPTTIPGETPVRALGRENPVSPVPTPRFSPRPRPAIPAGVQLGIRDRDGRGFYRCDRPDLRFAACNPDNIGEIVQYPVYDGHRADPLPPLGISLGVKLDAFDTPLQSSPPALVRKLPASASTPLGSAIVATARTYTGISYRWGGSSRAGTDCSGLTLQVLRARGFRPPRTADAQMRWSKRISRSAARPGDLAFRVDRSGHAYHVGIVTGNGRYIEAPNPGQRVSEHPIPSGAVFGRVT